jgi:hypothetical protein
MLFLTLNLWRGRRLPRDPEMVAFQAVDKLYENQWTKRNIYLKRCKKPSDKVSDRGSKFFKDCTDYVE